MNDYVNLIVNENDLIDILYHLKDKYDWSVSDNDLEEYANYIICNNYDVSIGDLEEMRR